MVADRTSQLFLRSALICVNLRYGVDLSSNLEIFVAIGVPRCSRDKEKLDFIQPLHVVDAGNLAQAAHHSFQVLDVFNIDHNVDGSPAVSRTGFNVADVGVIVADDGSKLLEHGRPVVTEDGQLDRISGFAGGGGGFRWLRPFDGNAAV